MYRVRFTTVGDEFNDRILVQKLQIWCTRTARMRVRPSRPGLSPFIFPA